MALLNILCYPDPRLHTVAKPVTQFDDALRTLVADMTETMYDAQGIGLAATQINVHQRVVVIDSLTSLGRSFYGMREMIEIITGLRRLRSLVRGNAAHEAAPRFFPGRPVRQIMSRIHGFPLSRSAFPITETLLRAIAAPAIMGLSSQPVRG